MKKLVFDVESIGLHGEGFAVGYIILDDGVVCAQYHASCPIDTSAGADSDREWVKANVSTEGSMLLNNPRELRDWFWKVIQEVKAEGGQVWTDCNWPVESNFLSACVADDPETRRWQGPYPLFDVSNLILASGLDPLESFPRLPDELPAHHALNDARQSARLLKESIEWLTERGVNIK